MAFGFYLPTKAAVVARWVPQFEIEFPVSAPLSFPEQLSASTAGGGLYVQEKGQALETFNLVFSLMAKVDKDALLIFFRDKAKGASNSFEYEDGDGALHKVKWQNGFDFPKTHAGLHTGTIQLRKVP